jgi:cytochrome c5
MKMLAAPATVLALWAVSAQAATNDDIAKRLEPVGQVCVQGKECKGMEVAASAGGGGGAKLTNANIQATLPLGTENRCTGLVCRRWRFDGIRPKDRS